MHRLLKEINGKNSDDTEYLIYLSAHMKASSLDLTNISPELAKSLKSFGSEYFDFMQEQCNSDRESACLQYGYLLEEDGNYDHAYAAYYKSAQAGNLSAMAALVDIYRNDRWSKNSEEKAQEWLMKIGK